MSNIENKKTITSRRLKLLERKRVEIKISMYSTMHIYFLKKNILYGML